MSFGQGGLEEGFRINLQVDSSQDRVHGKLELENGAVLDQRKGGNDWWDEFGGWGRY